MPPEAILGHGKLLLPVAPDLLPATESTADTADASKSNRTAEAPPSPSPPPLHDTEAHLRSVHALLDSLPAEFRSTQPRRQLPTSSPSSAVAMPMATTVPVTVPIDTLLELPSPSQEPEPPTRSPAGAPSETEQGRVEPPSLPELRRMLSSLDRVDRRLFALGECHGAGPNDDDDDGDGDGGGECAGAEKPGSGPGEKDTGDGKPAAVKSGPTSWEAGPVHPYPPAAATGVNLHGAISRLQQAWRAKTKKRRAAAEAEVEREAYALRRKRREEAAVAIQAAYRRAQARHRATAAARERRRREDRQRRRAAACAVLERAWRAFEARRRAARELAEARGRAAAAVAAAAREARRAEEVTRGAVLVQAVWRGMSARAAVARRFEASRARTLAAAAAAAAREALPTEQELLSHPATSTSARRLAAGVAPMPRPLPSTFYNQLSPDPRRRLHLPEAHLAAAPSAAPSFRGLPPPAARSLAASHSAAVGGGDRQKSGEQPIAELGQSERFGPRPLARSAGAVRAPRFADQETARIARIMKGNLQHWASARSSSSSDDVDL